MQNRSWVNEDHSDVPRVFYVAGRHIDYDQRTLEALIVGDGELLIRDERVDDADEEAAAGEMATGKGTSHFTWTKQLHMTRVFEGRFEIEMMGEAVCRHQGIAGRMFMISGETLAATVERAEEAYGSERTALSGAVDLGGSMELKRLYGKGGITIRTLHAPRRDVTCHEFDYNLVTGLAELSSYPGGRVSSLTGESGRPLRAEHILWNMNTDTITITRAAGSGAP